nr:MAG TPA: restriction alleviation protein [Caudoviricetes sp.]
MRPGRELENCPFCGSEAKLFSHEIDTGKFIWWVQCRNTHCLARQTPVNSKKIAVDRWNCREH